jgi:hypothetical protein
MPKRLLTILMTGLSGLAALLVAGLMLPTGKPGTALYVAAKSQTPFGDQLWSSSLPEHPTGDFLLSSGKLYLKVETVYHHFIDDSVAFTEWTPKRLDALLRDHPDLAPYLPDSGRSDQGITWLKAWGRK